jgi:MoxR-like ATPase
MAARRLGKKLHQIQGHADLMIEDLRGNPGLKAGNSTFTYSPVVEAARAGEILVFEEPNLCRPAATAWLNNAFDQPGKISIPETGECLPVHPEFRAILCFNAGYQGTRQINEALIDRCRVINCDYWPERDEIALLQAKIDGKMNEIALLQAKIDGKMNELSQPRLLEAEIRQMVRFANAIREARRRGVLDFDFSIRSLDQWGIEASLTKQEEPTQNYLLKSLLAVIPPKLGNPIEAGPQYTALLEIAKLYL